MFSPSLFIQKFITINDEYKIVANMLYGMYLNKFKTDIEEEIYELIIDHHHDIYKFVEEIRELDIDNIKEIFIELDKLLPCLVDIVIMTWSLPNASDFKTKIMYNNFYVDYIKKYNKKLFQLVEHYTVRNFCMESLIKKNSIPIHCIDILWFWMKSLDNYEIEMYFVNSGSANFINIEKNDNDLLLGINMEYIFDYGLGNESCLYGTFKDFLLRLINNKEFNERYSKFDKNYVMQRDYILKIL